jgi:N-acetylmuramic acid 6-phosphate etherase
MSALGLAARDFVLGIAASGTTPYTLAALDAARGAGCETALLCCNPRVTSGAAQIIALDTGPEVVAGSTRLKAGTATKLALNMISTGAMALSGYVYHGLMVGVRPVNAKLWRRATGIVEVVAACSREDAERKLREAGGDVSTAIVMARFELSRPDAEQRLRDCGGSLRAALDT